MLGPDEKNVMNRINSMRNKMDRFSDIERIGKKLSTIHIKAPSACFIRKIFPIF